MRHKARNGHVYAMKVQISIFSKLFSNLSFDFNFWLSQTYSFNLSLKNTLGLYVFKSLRQERKIYFEKSEVNSDNFPWFLLSSVAINVNLYFSLFIGHCKIFTPQKCVFFPSPVWGEGPSNYIRSL